MNNNKISKLRQWIDTSVFINVIRKISDFIHKKICTSVTARIFTSYDYLDQKASESLIANLITRITPRKRTVIKAKNTIAGKIEESFFQKFLQNVFSFLLGTKVRMYGLMLFIVGVMSGGIGIIEKYLIVPPIENTSLLWQGLLFIAISIPLLVSKEELGTSLVNGRISGVLLRFIGYKEEDLTKEPVGENVAVPVLLGVFLGLLALAVEPIWFLVVIFALVYLQLVFSKPEIGIILAVSTLPFVPTLGICAEIILVLLAYVIKVARGKRSIRFGLLDVFVFMFAIFMFFGGVISVSPSSSIPPTCVFLCFMISYFLIVNLVKTKELIKKLLSMSVVSFFICSLYGIYQNFFATPDTTWTDEDMFSDIETRVVSTFENPNVFGEYLIMLIPVALTLVIISKRFSERTFFFVTLGVSSLALVYTWSRGAWLGCLVALLIFFVIINKRALGTYLFLLLGIPAMIPFLPSSILERFSSIGNMADSSTSYRVFIWEASVKMIKDFLFTGIGIGTDAFQKIYTEYALAGIETAPHSHNLYLQILIELGIFGFAVFIITLVLFFSKVFTFMRDSENKEAKLIIGAIACGILAILAQGVTDYVWYNYRVFAFFWMMLGTASATINVYKVDKQLENNVM